MTAQQQQNPHDWLVGTYTDERAINQRLEWAARNCHLISPSTTCRLPAGCAVAFSLCWIDPATETHDVGVGKRSLLRTALLKLANAAGICWDVHTSGRVDPGTDPYYVHWHTSGAWRGLDGTVLPVPGDLQMDLRDGSQQVTKILESASSAEKGRVQLRDMRSKVLEHAQSKSQGRAIRTALALRSYTGDELQKKPFVVARLVFDGRDEDPEMERENKRAIRNNMLGGVRALFGPPPVQTERHPALMAPLEYRQVPELPPVGSVSFEDSAPELEPEPVRTDPAAPPPPAPTAQATPPATPAPAPTPRPVATAPKPASPPPDAPARSGAVIPGGRNRGQPIEDADDRDLTFWAERLADGLARGDKPQFRDSNQALLDAIRAEQNRRSGGELPPGWE